MAQAAVYTFSSESIPGRQAYINWGGGPNLILVFRALYVVLSRFSACKGKLKTDSDQNVLQVTEHNHMPNEADGQARAIGEEVAHKCHRRPKNAPNARAQEIQALYSADRPFFAASHFPSRDRAS